MEALLWKNLKTLEFSEDIAEDTEEECELLCVCEAKLIPKIEADFIWHPSNSF